MGVKDAGARFGGDFTRRGISGFIFFFFFLRHLNKTAFLTKVEAGDVISESGVRYKRVQG